MKHLALFAGIGGAALAADSVWDNVEHIFCEIDPFCQAVLRKNYPNSKIYGDIRELKGSEIGTVDLVTGGFPCQPFSSAGKQRGKNDDRDLWPEMFRIIREVKPAWILGENVAGFVRMELDRSLSDLEGEGYACQAFVIPACAVNAPHRRDRVWIVAYAEGDGNIRRTREIPEAYGGQERNNLSESHDTAAVFDTAPDSCGERRESRHERRIPDGERPVGSEDEVRSPLRSESEKRSPARSTAAYTPTSMHKGGVKEKRFKPLELGTGAFSEVWETRQTLVPSSVLCRSDDGIPDRVDRTKSLGNAWVPQVAAEIMRAMILTN